MLRLAQIAVTAALAAAAAAQTTRYRDPVFAQVDRTLDIAYGAAVNRFSQQNEVLRLDLYQPQGDTAASRAAVVVVHGGGFVGGSRRSTQIVQQCNSFARRGYVAVSISYRLAPQGTPIDRQVVTDAGHDCKAAVRWLRAQASTLRIDSERIASLGSSAGAFTVLEAAYVPGEGSSGNPGWPSHVACVADLWGGLWDVNELDAGEAPVVIVHGTNDPTVPFVRATSLQARANAVGVPVELHAIQNAGHAPWGAYFQSHEADVLAFFWEHLHLARVAGLTVRPGHGSPGSATFDHFAAAGDVSVLFVAAAPASIPVPGLGTLCLDPATLVAAATATLPATPRIATVATTVPVPPGLAGVTLPWQALHVQGTRARTLTDCVATGF